MKRKSFPTVQQINRPAFLAGLALLFWMAGAGLGHAHRVMVFVWIEGGTIYTQSKFPGDRAVSAGDIIVYDGNGNQLLKGETDKQGLFSFGLERLSSPGPVKIVLVAGMGHQASWELTAEEVAQAMGGVRPASLSLPVTEKAEATPSGKALPAASGAGGLDATRSTVPGLTEVEIQKIVDAALDGKFSPVMGMLVDIQEKLAVGLDDVIAGLGYIFGLAGVAAYAYARGRQK